MQVAAAFTPRQLHPRKNQTTIAESTRTCHLSGESFLALSRYEVKIPLGMAKNSTIEWTHHTFNPWWGCHRVSPACDNCYAEAWAHRLGQELWGARETRRFFGDTHWREPLRWNAEAVAGQRRERVFCASMADVFERRADLNEHRKRLWQLIEQTPNLDWLLLTKRPQHILRMTPWGQAWPHNVWIGTTVENQRLADLRLPELLQVPATVRFLSCEPLLGSLNLRPWFRRRGFYPIDWVIAGGESGAHSRPMHPDWALGLLQQCQRSHIPFHFKQWGHWGPANTQNPTPVTTFTFHNERTVDMVGAGKGRNGRLLQGTTWDGLPHLPVHG
jgi:protein gp37